VRLDRLDVHEHLALVIGRPAGVDLAVAHGRLERRRRPQVHRIHRLHVVVAVEEDRRPPRRAEPVAVDDRVSRRVEQGNVLQPGAAQRLGGPLGRPPYIRRMLWQRADAGNCQILLQLFDVSVAVDVDEVDDVIHGEHHN
jgi:hypothetical protein